MRITYFFILRPAFREISVLLPLYHTMNVKSIRKMTFVDVNYKLLGIQFTKNLPSRLDTRPRGVISYIVKRKGLVMEK